MNHQEFILALAKAKLEVEVRRAYILRFNLPVSTRFRTDLAFGHAIFEFKLDKNLDNPFVLAKIMAQVVYYIRAHQKLRKKIPIPTYFIIAERKSALIGKTEDFLGFIRNKDYDWTLNPSSPDKLLIANIVNSKILDSYRIFTIIYPQECKIFEGLLKIYLTGTQ